MAERTAEAGAVLAAVGSDPSGSSDQREALRWLGAMVGGEAR
jgi:hypothetical protein